MVLRLTNKTFSDASEPFLYQNISFDFYAKTVAEAERTFFRIRGLYEQLCVDGEKAAMVRRLEIREMNHLTVSPACVIPSFIPTRHRASTMIGYDALNSTDSTPEPEPRHQLFMVQLAVAALLSVIPSLETFHIAGTKKLGNHLAPLEVLEYATCPALKEFRLEVSRDSSWFPIQPTLACFLERHSQLTDITLEIEQTTGRGLLANADRPLYFPRLERFAAPAGGYSERLSKDTPLRRAELDFRPRPDLTRYSPLEPELVALQSFEALTSLVITRSPQEVETIALISTYLPQLEDLELRHTDLTYRLPLVPERIEAFASALSPFKALQRLTYLWAGHGRIRTMADRSETIDRATVSSWGTACPTLAYCSLYGSSWKRVDAKWVFLWC